MDPEGGKQYKVAMSEGSFDLWGDARVQVSWDTNTGTTDRKMTVSSSNTDVTQ
jgi:hypothetical protein